MFVLFELERRSDWKRFYNPKEGGKRRFRPQYRGEKFHGKEGRKDSGAAFFQLSWEGVQALAEQKALRGGVPFSSRTTHSFRIRNLIIRFLSYRLPNADVSETR